jgi:hypothetical protein
MQKISMTLSLIDLLPKTRFSESSTYSQLDFPFDVWDMPEIGFERSHTARVSLLLGKLVYQKHA